VQLPKDLLNVVGKERMVWADKPLFTPFILKRLPALIFPLLFMLFPLLIFWGTGDDKLEIFSGERINIY